MIIYVLKEKGEQCVMLTARLQTVAQAEDAMGDRLSITEWDTGTDSALLIDLVQSHD